MASIPSNIADLAWAIQSAKGSAVADGSDVFRAYLAGGEQPHGEQVREDFEETTGGRMLSDSYVSQASVTGAPEFFVMPKSIGSLLYGVLGAKAVSGAGDPYTHTFTWATTVPYFTFWRMLGNGLYEKLTDCIITHLKIHGESGKPLRVTPTIMGLTPTYLASSVAAASVEKTQRFMHYDGAGALKVEGTAVSHIRSFDLDVDNGAAIVPGDSLTPNDVSIGRLTIEMATTQLVTDFTLWKRLMYASSTPSGGDPATSTPLELAGSPAGLAPKWTRVAASRTLEVLIPRVQVLPFADVPDVSGNPLVRQVTYRAFAPTDGSTPMTAKVLNSLASY